MAIKRMRLLLLLFFLTATSLIYFQLSLSSTVHTYDDKDGGVPFGGNNWLDASSGVDGKTPAGSRQKRFSKICSVDDSPNLDSYRNVSIDDFLLHQQASNSLSGDQVSSFKRPADDDAAAPFVRIIHRMWKSADVPPKWDDGRTTCRRFNPDWLYCHWTDDDLLSFVSADYPDFLPTYIGYRYPIQRADAARYFLLYHYAGIYLDLDIACRRSFDSILDDVANASWSTGNDVILAEAEPSGVVSDFLGVRRRRDPLMRHVVVGLPDSAAAWYPLPYVAVMFGTGPVFLSRRTRDFNETSSAKNGGSKATKRRMTIVPSRLYSRVYFGHMAGGTWHSWDGLVIWTVYRLRHRILMVVGFGTLVVASMVALRRRTNRVVRSVIIIMNIIIIWLLSHVMSIT